MVGTYTGETVRTFLSGDLFMHLRSQRPGTTLVATLLTCLGTIAGLTVAAVPATAVTTGKPTIVAPTDGAQVPYRSTGPYTVDFTGSPAGNYIVDVFCANTASEQVYAISVGVPSWDGATDPVRSYTGPELPKDAARCSVQVYNRAGYTLAAYAGFTVAPSTDPVILSPTDGDIVPAGYTGPFTVDLTPAPAGSYRPTVACEVPHTRIDFAEDFPTISWDGSTDPVHTFTLTGKLAAPHDNCYFVVARQQTDGSPVPYGKVTFAVDYPPLKLTDVTQTPATFYPRVRDGYRDTTTTGFRLNAPATVEVTVTNSDGKTVRSFRNGYRAGLMSWAWNGRDNNGAKVPLGSYTIRLTGRDDLGTVRTATTKTTVASKLVTRTGSGKISGYYGARSASSGCSATRSGYDSTVELDCWGGRYARAKYRFTVPATTFDSSVTVAGYKPDSDICCDGKITKVSSQPDKTTLVVTVQVSGWRAYVVKSVSASWSYKKRI